MINTAHKFALEFLTTAGAPLGQVPLQPDWQPAFESTHFSALRHQARLPVEKLHPARRVVTVEPVPDSNAGLPYCDGFSMVIRCEGEVLAQGRFAKDYFRRAARAHSAVLIEQGQLQPGEVFLYRLLAYPVLPPVRETAASGSLVVEEVETPPPVRQSSTTPLRFRARPFGQSRTEDIGVFLAENILTEAESLTLAAGSNETGGILVGHLHHDVTLPDIAVEITAQIPARLAEGELTKLTFTPDTWAAVRSALALRRRNELMLGWWHSHPAKFWCSPQCPPERRRACPLVTTALGLSGDDLHLHQTIFPKAYTVALLLAHTDDGLSHAFFGWRDGIIQPRGFNVLDSTRPLSLSTVPDSDQPDSHEKACTS